MSEVLSVRAAKAKLPQLVKRAAAGEEILIGRGGRAEVKLVRADAGERRPRRFGVLQGRLQLPADLDAPLPEHVVRSFEGNE